MTVDYLPSVKAFCEERIKILRTHTDRWEPTPEGHFHPDNPTGQKPPSPVLVAFERIDELQMIVTLCNGLSKQQEMLTDALRPK